MQRYIYKIYNLQIASEIKIPEAQELRDGNPDHTDVVVGYGKLPEHLDVIRSSGVLYEISDEGFLLRLPSIGKYLARSGREIIIDPHPGITDDEVRLFLLGSVMGAILHQRGFLPVHGSSIRHKNEAVVITGNSATGKSTLAASLALKGYPLISDDLSVISMNAEGNCVMHTGLASVKLWKDVSDTLHPGRDFQRVRPQIQKFRVPVSVQDQHPDELVVKKVILLTSRNEPGFDMNEISGANKLKILRENIYRDQVIKGLGMMENHFRLLSQLSNQTHLFHVVRPSGPLLIDEFTEYVINRIF